MIHLDDAQQLEWEKRMSTYKSVNNNRKDARKELMPAMVRQAILANGTSRPDGCRAAGIYRE